MAIVIRRLLFVLLLPVLLGGICMAEEPAVMRIVKPVCGSVFGIDDRVNIEITGVPSDVVDVSVSCDGTRIGTLDKPPFAFRLRTKPFPVGRHTLSAVAHSGDGKTLEMDAVPFTIYDGVVSSFPSLVAPLSAGGVLLHRGAAIPLCVIEKLEGGKTKVGDEVKLVVAEDVLGPNRAILIPEGAFAYGTITESRKPKDHGRGGGVSFTIERTDTPAGAVVPIRASYVGIPHDVEYHAVVSPETTQLATARPFERSPSVLGGTPSLDAMASPSSLTSQMATGSVRGQNLLLLPGDVVYVFASEDTVVKPAEYRVSDVNPPKDFVAGADLGEKASVRIGEALQVHVSAEPIERVKAIRVLVDHQVRWEAEPRDKSVMIQTNDFSKGKHELCVEIVLADGGVMKRQLSFEMVK